MKKQSANIFLNISAKIIQDFEYSDNNLYDDTEFDSLKSILQNVAMSIRTYAASIAFGLGRPNDQIQILFDPHGHEYGMLVQILSFVNKTYQRNLLLVNTECNNALLNYISDVISALQYEEKQCAVNNDPEYCICNSISGNIEIETDTNRILYVNKEFPKFVKSIGTQLLKLFELNKNYKIFIFNNHRALILFPISTFLTGHPYKSRKTCRFIGKAYPVIKKGVLTHFQFIEYGSKKVYNLHEDNYKESKTPKDRLLSGITLEILFISLKESNYISINASHLINNVRNLKSTTKDLIFRELLTLTLSDREALKK